MNCTRLTQLSPAPLAVARLTMALHICHLSVKCARAGTGNHCRGRRGPISMRPFHSCRISSPIDCFAQGPVQARLRTGPHAIPISGEFCSQLRRRDSQHWTSGSGQSASTPRQLAPLTLLAGGQVGCKRVTMRHLATRVPGTRTPGRMLSTKREIPGCANAQRSEEDAHGYHDASHHYPYRAVVCWRRLVRPWTLVLTLADFR
jgi:hypothetical protein